MRVYLKIAIGMGILFGVSSPNVWAQDDWQLWNGYSLKAGISEDYSLKVTGEQRFRNDMSESSLGNVSPGFLWHPSRYFEIGPFFKYERSKNSVGKHVNEGRWLLEATLKGRLGRFKISDRNRIAYRDRNTSDGWRYRNQVKMALPWDVKGITIAPFVSEEIFWDINPGSLSQNRVQMGVDTKLTEHVSFSLYYMIRSDRTGKDWRETNVLGTGIGFSF